jgi:DNA-binding winged helix-turn-helix (wHTH) protein
MLKLAIRQGRDSPIAYARKHGVSTLGSIFSFDEFEFDVDKQELRRSGLPAKADGLLLRLLEVFVCSPNQLITKQELLV